MNAEGVISVCRSHQTIDPIDGSRMPPAAGPVSSTVRDISASIRASTTIEWSTMGRDRVDFRGAENVQRVQEWRKAHPGYWKRSPRKTGRTLQDACSAQPAAIKTLVPVALPKVCRSTLQDVCQVQAPLMVGLISNFTDCTLQDDIVLFVRRLIAKGQDILDQPSSRSTKQNVIC